MELFTVSKIPMYCEGITHRLEQRATGDVKIVELTLKLDTFDGQMASALHDDYSIVKRTLFRMNDGEPNTDLQVVEFHTPSDRQKLRCYAVPDTEKASICFDQVKVTKLRAKRVKGAANWLLFVHVSFGPVDKGELMYVNEWFAGERYVSWEEAEPSLDFKVVEPKEDKSLSRPQPMFDDDGNELSTEAPVVADGDSAARVLPMPGGKASKKKAAAPAPRRTH
jgi:hypothetical protein